MTDVDHGRFMTLCLREAGDWTVFLRYRGADEYAFLGRRGGGATEARFVLRSTAGAVDFLLQIMDDSPVGHELLLMPAATAQQTFDEMNQAAVDGTATSLVLYQEARPLSHDRAELLLRLLRECRPI